MTKTPNNPSDAEVVAGCLDGDPGSLERLLGACWATVLDAARQALRSSRPQDHSCTAEDLLDEFFLLTLSEPRKVLGKFDPSRGTLQGWIRGVAIHQISNMLREHRFRWPGEGRVVFSAQLDCLPSGGSSGPSDPAEFLEVLLAKIDNASSALLREKYGMPPFDRPTPVDAIARREGLTRWQVYGRIHKAINELRLAATRSRSMKPGKND